LDRNQATRMTTRIVITGAPGSGKSVCLEHLRQTPGLAGFVFFEELARKLLAENPGFRNDRTAFHREIYRQQTAREAAVEGKSFITDRGTVDAFAFHPETLADAGSTLEREYARYSAVIHLGSSARLGVPFYQVDEIRNESIADALIIETAIGNAWRGHRGYTFVDAREDFTQKVRECERLVLGLASRE
jgi:predicted ATPase